jgi:hypothetical protein
MELGALCVLHAVHRPCATVFGEVFRLRWVPVTTLEYRIAALEKFFDQLVERRYDFTAVWHRQRATGTKIVLHINDDQRPLFLVWHYLYSLLFVNTCLIIGSYFAVTQIVKASAEMLDPIRLDAGVARRFEFVKKNS